MRLMKHYFTLISCTVRPKTVLGVTFHWPQEALRTFSNFVILISNHDLDKSAVKIEIPMSYVQKKFCITIRSEKHGLQKL